MLVCLTEGRPIPSFQWPIFNVAMSDCVVTCSHIPKTRKLEIKEKIQSMGGIYTDKLVQKNTHLVTDSVLSEKYAVSLFFVCLDFILKISEDFIFYIYLHKVKYYRNYEMK